MMLKICKRCQFRAQAKARICAICGSASFEQMRDPAGKDREDHVNAPMSKKPEALPRTKFDQSFDFGRTVDPGLVVPVTEGAVDPARLSPLRRKFANSEEKAPPDRWQQAWIDLRESFLR